MDPDAAPPAAAAAGEPPSPVALSAGCPFHPRCQQAMDVCRDPPAPALRQSDQVEVACHLYPV
jgi:oligopeptide/dipeptide ABC transporter ATP-binding protein